MKSHFQMSKQQRNGVFALIISIVTLQLVRYMLTTEQTKPKACSAVVTAFNTEVDSLKALKVKQPKKKLYPFNPNYITDYKGYVLGLSAAEMDRLFSYRKQNKWVNSAKEFQKVTQISDSLLITISPYFKFPSWVNTAPKKANINTTNRPKTVSQKIDLNSANAIQLQRVYGIGPTLSQQIIAYRTKNNGFIDAVELQEIYGLTAEVITRVKADFVVKTPRKIKRYNLNTATRNELVTIPFLDYENVNNIIEARTLHEGFTTIEELTKIEDFPTHKLHIIKLYLFL